MHSVLSAMTIKQSITLNHLKLLVEMKSDCSEGHTVNDAFNELENGTNQRPEHRGIFTIFLLFSEDFRVWKPVKCTRSIKISAYKYFFQELTTQLNQIQVESSNCFVPY